MKLNTPMKELLDCSEYGLTDLVPPEKDDVWNSNLVRQTRSSFQRDTRSIVSKWLGMDSRRTCGR